MKRIHIALSTDNIQASIEDYTRRLGCPPAVVVPNEYALYKTDILNLSVRRDSSAPSCALRHLGFEDENATNFSSEPDVNNIQWEQFSESLQLDEILEIWPHARING